MNVVVLCLGQPEGGAWPHVFTQTVLDEPTESFVPKTKPNLCQTHELKRPHLRGNY